MLEDTPFGELRLPHSLPIPRKKAILRALSWCLSIISKTSFWNISDKEGVDCGKGVSRKIGKKTLTVYPLVAARMDSGVEANHLGISFNHLPIQVNGRSVCVVPMNRSKSLLHTDMVASILQLFCTEKPPTSVIPYTLGRRLYPEDYPRPPVNMHGVYVGERRNEIFETLRQRAVLIADAVDYALNELEHEDWVLLRDHFPWDEQPNLALHLSAALMTPERSEQDWQWLLDVYQRHEHEEYVTFLLPNLFNHFHANIILRAIDEHRFGSQDEAWGCLAPLLRYEDENVRIAAHRSLATFDNLEERLIDESLSMLPEPRDHRDVSSMETYLAAWLSHKIEIEDRLENIVTHLDAHRLVSFLKDSNLQGDWFLPYAEAWIEQPFLGVHGAIVECTSKNPRIDHHKLWLELMKNGRGTLQSLILEHLDVMDDESAFEFLDIGWKSHLRYIVRRTHETVENSYPNYPRMQEMYLHGYENSPSPRIRGHCLGKIVEQYPQSEIFNHRN